MKQKVQNQSKLKVHIVTLGDTTVGKTSLINRYIGNYFNSNYIATVGMDSCFKQLNYKMAKK